jgi:hypothetical protein
VTKILPALALPPPVAAPLLATLAAEATAPRTRKGDTVLAHQVASARNGMGEGPRVVYDDASRKNKLASSARGPN